MWQYNYGPYLMHYDHKYLSKKYKNGKWVYRYDYGKEITDKFRKKVGLTARDLVKSREAHLNEALLAKQKYVKEQKMNTGDYFENKARHEAHAKNDKVYQKLDEDVKTTEATLKAAREEYKKTLAYKVERGRLFIKKLFK